MQDARTTDPVAAPPVDSRRRGDGWGRRSCGWSAPCSPSCGWARFSSWSCSSSFWRTSRRCSSRPRTSATCWRRARRSRSSPSGSCSSSSRGGIDLSVGSTLALSSVVGALVFAETGAEPRRSSRCCSPACWSAPSTDSATCTGELPHPFIVTLATLSIARGLALGISGGQPISGMPDIVTAIGGGIGDLARPVVPELGLPRRGRGDRRRAPADEDGVGPLDLRRRRQPGGRPPAGHPPISGARLGLRAQRAARRGRGDRHLGPAERRLTDLRAARRARRDRRGRDRRRQLPRRPRHTSVTRWSARS